METQTAVSITGRRTAAGQNLSANLSMQELGTVDIEIPFPRSQLRDLRSTNGGT